MNDCISREAVLEHYRVSDPAGTFAFCNSILDFVSSLPAADVKPVVRGKWLHKEAYDFYEERWSSWVECSECGELAQVNGLGKYERTNFCPSCGADMREDKQE